MPLNIPVLLIHYDKSMEETEKFAHNNFLTYMYIISYAYVKTT